MEMSETGRWDRSPTEVQTDTGSSEKGGEPQLGKEGRGHTPPWGKGWARARVLPVTPGNEVGRSLRLTGQHISVPVLGAVFWS